MPWTLADFPTLSLPLDWAPDGLPRGIQVSAPPMAERSPVEAGRWIEHETGFSGRHRQ